MRTYSPDSPPPKPGARGLHTRFCKGRGVSDCTPPTGVRPAALNGFSELRVKSPAFSTPTHNPAFLFFIFWWRVLACQGPEHVCRYVLFMRGEQNLVRVEIHTN